MLRRRLLLSVVVLLVAVAPASAEVKWANTDVVLDLTSADDSGVATFGFVNNETTPVKIVKVAPGCGCTVPTLEKQEFAAGESGSFTARFTVGERRGVYRIPIHVAFEDGTTSELSLVVKIRELVKYVPEHLIWDPGEARTPKDIELHWKASDPVEVTKVRSISPSFKVELVPEDKWHGALVRVTPLGDKLTGTTVVMMQTAQGPGKRSRVYTVVGRAL